MSLSFNVPAQVLQCQRENRKFERDGKTTEYVDVVLSCLTHSKPPQVFHARPAFGVSVNESIKAGTNVDILVSDLRTEKGVSTVRFTEAILKV